MELYSRVYARVQIGREETSESLLGQDNSSCWDNGRENIDPEKFEQIIFHVPHRSMSFQYLYTDETTRISYAGFMDCPPPWQSGTRGVAD